MVLSTIRQKLALVLMGAMVIAGSGGCVLGSSQDAAGNNAQKISSEKPQVPAVSYVEWDTSWEYSSASAINTGHGTLYKTSSISPANKTVCINAGHGTRGGETKRTLCHPDGSPKVTGGSTASGAVYATAVSSGTMLGDGTPEAEANLMLASIVKEQLLNAGFDVLMVRDEDDVQLDNVARTVMANQKADCHIAIHYDSTASDKGAFCITVPDSVVYKAMEPVSSHWQDHERLADCLISGLMAQGIKMFGDGKMKIDLTQTSYSTIPSIDLEVGDKASDRSREHLETLARGVVGGVQAFFGAGR